MVIHTREGHLPDMTDCPTNKLDRWPAPRIGDVGPMGRILIQGEVGHAIIDELAPWPNELVIDKPGKNAFYRTKDLSKNKCYNFDTSSDWQNRVIPFAMKLGWAQA